jgi:carboxymethylenebutenolidase
MKKIFRILRGLLLGLLTLIILLALSIPVDALRNRNTLDGIANTTLLGIDGNPDIRAYVATPKGDGPFPTVIMIHEFFGLSESIARRADLLAESGYLVIAPDVFRGMTTSWIPRAIYNVISSDAEQVYADLDSTYAWLGSQPQADLTRVATLGFCFGGRTSLGYSLHNNQIAATVIFYGDPITDPAVLKDLPGPVLGIFGGADASIPVENVQAFGDSLTQLGIEHQLTTYEGQPHGFVDSVESIKAGGAQQKAWNEMLAFLEANLKNASATRNGNASTYLIPIDLDYYLRVALAHTFHFISEHAH